MSNTPKERRTQQAYLLSHMSRSPEWGGCRVAPTGDPREAPLSMLAVPAWVSGRLQPRASHQAGQRSE